MEQVSLGKFYVSFIFICYYVWNIIMLIIVIICVVNVIYNEYRKEECIFYDF